MIDLKGIINFTQWPRDDDGNPVITCSEDAYFYAGLIFQNRDECFNILRLRCLALANLERFDCIDKPDLQVMLNLACKAQLYRECLEEIRRIRIDDKTL